MSSEILNNEVVIRVEGLGKQYMIGHERGGREGYSTLRDMIGRSARRLARSTINMACGRPIVIGDTIEELWALNDVSFDVNRGEVLGIIGRNGAGKSTLLKILSRITEPTRGRVEIKGRVASLLEVGTGFHPELTGRENIYLNGAILGMTSREIRRKFDEIVGFAEVEKFLDTPVKRYSSGMYVRLAFAVAAHLEPEILIIDEVLAVGDVDFQRKCLGKMSEVAGNGRTVLFVSHNVSAVANLCDRAILLAGGSVTKSGAARDVLASYLRNSDKGYKVSFPENPRTPTITGVRLNPDQLSCGNLEIEVDFVSPFPLQRPTPGIVIHSSEGIPVFGSNTLLHEYDFESRSPWEGTFVLKIIQLPLHNGSYSLSVWLGDVHDNYDVKMHVVNFELDCSAFNPFIQSVHDIGAICWPATWSMKT